MGNRISPTFTKKQIELIETLANSGVLGDKPTDVVRNIVIEYLKQKFPVV